MAEDDIFAILYEGPWPFVLRPIGDKFRIIGFCYVEGIMLGEPVRQNETEGGKDDVFDIV